MPIKQLYEGGNVPAGGDDLLITSKKILGQLWNLSSGTTGTVTSVGLALPSIFTVSGSPVTTSGTLTGVFTTQVANTIFGGPATGADATPTFRALIAADIPNLAASKITTGQLALARGGTASDLSATGGTSQVLKQVSVGAVVTVGQLAFTDLSGSASVAQIPSLPASQITSGQLALARGGTNADLSATGGASQVLKQTSVGSVVTVAQLSYSDISGTVPISLPVQATYVDNTNGSDGTGVAGRFDKPYKTIQAAITATTAPLSVVVRADATSYDEKITLKNNVAVWMEKGAVLTYTGSSGTTVTYPGTSNENYILRGYGKIVSAASTGGDAAVSGGVAGTGYMILEADQVIGQGTNGNRAINLITAQIDPSTVAIQPSYIKIQYVESNNKVANYAVDLDWAGGPAYLWFGTINNISTTAGSRAFEIEGQAGLGDYCLELFIDKVIDTASTASVGQDSVHLVNNGGGITPFSATINYIMAGNKCALGIADNVWVKAVVIQNNSSSVPTVHGEAARITGALIQNISSNSTSTPIIDTNIYDDRILYEDCRFENPNSNPGDSVIKLANFAGTFDRFKDCVFYLAGTDADGLVNLDKSDGANFIGNNIILRRTGSAPSIGAASAKVARIYGNLFVNPDKDADITPLGGNIIYDSAMVIGNSISTYWA